MDGKDGQATVPYSVSGSGWWQMLNC